MNTDLLILAGFTGGGVFLTLAGLTVASALGMDRGVTHYDAPAPVRAPEPEPELVTVQSVRLDLPEAA